MAMTQKMKFSCSVFLVFHIFALSYRQLITATLLTRHKKLNPPNLLGHQTRAVWGNFYFKLGLCVQKFRITTYLHDLLCTRNTNMILLAGLRGGCTLADAKLTSFNILKEDGKYYNWIYNLFSLKNPLLFEEHWKLLSIAMALLIASNAMQ